MKCIMCQSSKLKLFLDLGKMPLVDKFPTKHTLQNEKFYPLRVSICTSCKLVQLSYRVSPDKMFNSKYAYESSITKSRMNNYTSMAKEICQKFKIPKNSLVVDIGSNVGMLLKAFKSQHMDVIGVEPSSNVAKIAISNNVETIIDFFKPGISSKIIKNKGNASIITATNVFAHIHDLNSFMRECKILLKKNGIFIFQSPYLLHLLNNNEYDTIYHEHISYLSITPLVRFFKKFDMEIFDIKEIEIDGGAIRCFICNKGERPISNNVQKFITLEKKSGIHTLKLLNKFAKNIEKQKKELLQILLYLKKENKKIVGVSAPAKGIILLNYCNIKSNILDYVTEKSKLKIGKFTPGVHIPVYSDVRLLDDNPDYFLILAWNFAEEIMKNLKKYKKKNGHFIIPIPYPKII